MSTPITRPPFFAGPSDSHATCSKGVARSLYRPELLQAPIVGPKTIGRLMGKKLIHSVPCRAGCCAEPRHG